VGSGSVHGRLREGPELARALARHLEAHNRHALLLALGTAVAALLLWVALYVVARWLTLLAVTVIGDGTAPVPRGFDAVFATAMAGLLAYAWVDRRLTPDDRPRDQKSAVEIAQDLILLIPRVTLAIFSTLGVRQRLPPPELDQAAAFLTRLAGAERLPMQAAGYDFPLAEARDRILLALQITGLIDVLHTREGAIVSLGTRLPAAFRLEPSN